MVILNSQHICCWLPIGPQSPTPPAGRSCSHFTGLVASSSSRSAEDYIACSKLGGFAANSMQPL